MAKMFDKVSQDFLSAIKGVLEAKKVNKHGHDHPGEEDADIDNDGDTDKSDKYLHNRRKAISKAMKKESAEQVDEMSSKMKMKLGLYGKKKKMKEETEPLDELSVGAMKKYRTAARADAMDADDVDDERRFRKRAAGSNTAGKKIVRKGGSLKEAEQIDEISADMKSRYKKGAQRSLDQAQDFKSELDHEGEPKGSRVRKDVNRIIKNRKVGMKRANEEVENLDELSKKTLATYAIKAKDQMGRDEARAGYQRGIRTMDGKGQGEMERAHDKRAEKRSKGIDTALNKLAKEETQIDELSTDTMRSYMDKASDARGHRKLPTKKVDNRYSGVQKASAKLAKEEADQIDELSKPTMGRYINKAKDSIDIASYRQGNREALGGSSKSLEKKLTKRHKGISMAVDKLTKEEIAMIEAKMAGVAPGSMDCDKHMCATKVFHKEWAEGTPIKTMHADPDAEGLIEWYDVMFDHGIERVMTEDMEILQAESHMHSKKKMKEEAEDLDEARGRPKKAGQMDYTVHPVTKEKMMHNNPEHMKRIEKLQKTGMLEKPKREASQHIMNQLSKAKTSMRGGETIHFTHGEAKHVSGSHAAKLITKYQGMKPAEKEDFQKKIGHSHEQLMKHV